MAEVKSKRLLLGLDERPEWWIAGAFVKIIAEKRDDFFIWARDGYEPGAVQIAEDFSIECLLKPQSELKVYRHSDQSIRIMSSKESKKRESREETARTVRETAFDTANTKEDYSKLYRSMFSMLLNCQISTRQFDLLTARIHLLLQDWDLFFTPPKAVEDADWQNTVESIIKNPANNDTQKLAAIKFKLEHNKQAKKERKTIVLKVDEQE